MGRLSSLGVSILLVMNVPVVTCCIMYFLGLKDPYCTRAGVFRCHKTPPELYLTARNGCGTFCIHNGGSLWKFCLFLDAIFPEELHWLVFSTI